MDSNINDFVFLDRMTKKPASEYTWPDHRSPPTPGQVNHLDPPSNNVIRGTTYSLIMPYYGSPAWDGGNSAASVQFISLAYGYAFDDDVTGALRLDPVADFDIGAVEVP